MGVEGTDSRGEFVGACGIAVVSSVGGRVDKIPSLLKEICLIFFSNTFDLGLVCPFPIKLIFERIKIKNNEGAPGFEQGPLNM